MVRQAIRATTAAPTFFTPLMINGALYSDGALLCNNPSAVAYHEAKVRTRARTHARTHSQSLLFALVLCPCLLFDVRRFFPVCCLRLLYFFDVALLELSCAVVCCGVVCCSGGVLRLGRARPGWAGLGWAVFGCILPAVACRSYTLRGAFCHT